MATTAWWYATDVDVTNGSPFVQVNSGDDLSFFEGQEYLQVRGYDAVEVKTRNTQTGVIELAKPWAFNSDSGRSAEAFPTAANLIETNRKLNRLIELYEGTFDGVLDNIAEVLTSEDATITIPTSEGDVQVVPYGFIRDAIETEWAQYKQDFDVALAQQTIKEKVKRDATLYLDFANNEYHEYDELAGNILRNIGQAIDYTCSTAATGETRLGKIKEVSPNVPRLISRDGESRGLLVEPSKTNLWTHSENLTSSGTSWGNTRLSVSVTTLDSPVIGAKWNRATENTESSTHTITQPVTSVSGQVLSAQIVAKKEERSQIRLVLPSGAFGGSFTAASFDLDTGEVFDTTPSQTQAEIENLSDGSFRCLIWREATTSTTANAEIRLMVGGSNTYQGDGTSGLLLTAAQSEQGFPTSYIKTEGSQVTRGDMLAKSQDVSVVRKFSMFVDCYPELSSSSGTRNNLIGFNKDDLPGTRGVGIQANMSGVRGAFRTDTVSSYNQLDINLTSKSRLKALLTYDGQEAKVVANGQLEKFPIGGDVTDFIESLFLNRLSMGGTTDNASNSHALAAIVPYVLSDAEAIALTTLEN